MNILIVTENAYCGGLDSFIITLINHWPEQEDEITLACNASHPGLAVINRQLKRPCKVIAHDYPLPWSMQEMRHNRWLRILRYPFRLLGRQMLFIKYLRLFRELFEQTKAQRLLVVNGGYPAGLTCRAATVAWGMAGKWPQSIHNFHNFSQPARWFEKPFENVIDRLVHRHTKALVSVSAICARSLVNRPALRESPRVTYIYNGIEFRPARSLAVQVKAGLGMAANAPLCLMLGTYEARKGHEFMLDAFIKITTEMPTVRLLICGFGYPDEIARVGKAVQARGLEQQVMLEGFREDVPDLLAASAVMLVPSQSSESFGLTIVEAMSHAVPVIATRVGGMPEVLQDGCGGYLVEPDDVDGLADRILRLLGDEILRQEQGRLGQARFNENFRAERMASSYASLLRAPDQPV
jgi:glycosyltransferase involved in cell wall biosynthesis